jgi:hypothetical protein
MGSPPVSSTTYWDGEYSATGKYGSLPSSIGVSAAIAVIWTG